MNTLAFTAALSVALAIQTCSGPPSPVAAEEYVQWVESPDNGLHLSKQIGELTFELQFKPLDYLVLQDHAGEPLSEALHQQERTALQDMQYFTLRISGKDGGDLLRSDAQNVDEFSSRLAYFSGQMQHDIRLIEGADTLACLLYHFERTYGIDPRSTFTLGFPLSKNDGPGGLPASRSKTLFLNDHELGAGPVLITIDAQQLEQLPPLNLTTYATAADPN